MDLVNFGGAGGGLNLAVTEEKEGEDSLSDCRSGTVLTLLSASGDKYYHLLFFPYWRIIFGNSCRKLYSI